MLGEIVSGIVEGVIRAFLDRSPKVAQGQEAASAQPRPVAFKAASGHFISADRQQGGLLVADRAECREWEVFFLHDLGGGRVRLQASGRQWVCAVDGGGRELVANRDTPLDWETFRLEWRGPRVALRTHDGHFACAEGGGGSQVVANRSEVKEWELFELVWLD